ncbi:MAG: polysaccharide deacetylase family protein [Thermoleophilia bacterium]
MSSARSSSRPATRRRAALAAALAAAAAAVLAAGCGGGGGDAAPAGSSTPVDTAPAAPPAPPALSPEVAARTPNEAGLVPVLMYHRIVAVDDGNPYSRSIEQFRADLDRLWREGFVPVKLGDLVAGRIAVPKGRSPVVITFDDATGDQFRLLDDGSVDPVSAVGIMNAFAEEHPDFGRHAIFYLNAGVFDQPELAAQKLKQLVDWGYELGNHTFTHSNLRDDTPAQAKRDIARMTQLIGELLPGYKVRHFCLPFGVMPENPKLLERGTWQGVSYRHVSNVLVGAEPAPSPFATRFDPMNIPRIRGAGTAEDEYQIDYWLDLMGEQGTAFVSDGDPRTVTVSADIASKVAVRRGQRLVTLPGAAPATTTG